MSLSPRNRDFLKGLLEQHEPSAADLGQLAKTLEKSLNVTIPVQEGTLGELRGDWKREGGGWGRSLRWRRISVLGVGLGVGAIGLLFALRSQVEHSANVVAAPKGAVTTLTGGPSVEPAHPKDAPTLEAEPVEPEPVEAEQHLSPPAIAKVEQKARPKKAAADDGAQDSSLELETALLQRAYAARRTGNFKEDLSLVKQHASRFPRGLLCQEREVERGLALCGLGRTEEAIASARNFAATWPGSPLRERLRASCAGGEMQ